MQPVGGCGGIEYIHWLWEVPTQSFRTPNETSDGADAHAAVNAYINLYIIIIVFIGVAAIFYLITRRRCGARCSGDERAGAIIVTAR